jgi:hypothetical protein
VRFQVLTAAGMKMTAFWDIAPCHHSFLIIEVVSTSKTSVDFYETIRHFFPRVVIIRAMMEALQKRQSTSARLHGAIAQKAITFRKNCCFTKYTKLITTFE